MVANSFHAWWIVSLILLLGLAYWIGRQTEYGPLGILIDSRGRYSLAHFQIVLWSITILSSVAGVLISSRFDPSTIRIPPELLGLMGISTGSAMATAVVKATKDASDPPARVARLGQFPNRDGTSTTIRPRLAQLWLEEEGEQHDKVVDITKYQNFIFTLVVFSIYVTAAWNMGGLPELPNSVVWLIGISHAGYVGAKVPNKA